MHTDRLDPALVPYLRARSEEASLIAPARRTQLDVAAGWIRSTLADRAPVRLIFVCTHNSRRSHFAHLWAAAAAEACALEIETFSGGTEATAFNPRAVAALQRAGFPLQPGGAGPVYHARPNPRRAPLPCFSKKYDDPSNPREGFAVVMVCGEADEACPIVPGASRRFTLTYEDPKSSDGTTAETAAYDERCAQIAREMMYLMNTVRAAPGTEMHP